MGAGRAGALAALGVFWLYLLVRWVNDWFGGVVVPKGTAFVPPSTLDGVAAGVPVAGGVVDATAFALEHLPALASATWLTVVMTVVGIGIGFLFAVPLAVARVYGRVSAYVSLAITELLRGTPLLAQLFMLYYGLNLSASVPGVFDSVLANRAVAVATLGFVINSAAYQAEYVRGAIESVDTGQLAAGRAVGLSKLEAIRFVVLPQGLRFAIPGWSNELVYLIKYSSLAAFVTVPELFDTANQIASDNFRYTAVFALTALLYLALVLSASRLTGWAERTTAIPGLGATSGEQ
ncbi:amino acid ABC transporter permease [Halobaculum sp. MBLA0147]|uniref:amino acid ABC transporter permease n=1 Tax=Halobaculum sp. MBLA0147 TaxID=3079934 RepID=UPI00352679D3